MTDSVYKHVKLSIQQYYDLLRQVAVEIPDTILPTDYFAYKKEWMFNWFLSDLPPPSSLIGLVPESNIKVVSDCELDTLYKKFYEIALTVYHNLYSRCWEDRCWTRQYLQHLATVDATTRMAKWSALKRQWEESIVVANQNQVEELLEYTDCDPLQIGRVEQLLDATVTTNQHYKTKRPSALRNKKAVKDQRHNVYRTNKTTYNVSVSN